MDKHEIESWMIRRLRELSSVNSMRIVRDQPLARLGLDSVTLYTLFGELEELLGVEVHPGMIRKHKTIAELAEVLLQQQKISTGEEQAALLDKQEV
jgi:acyl carrier protein